MTKKKALEKLNILLDELNSLPPFVYKGDNSSFDKWKRKAARYIENIFNNVNNQSTEFTDISFTKIHVVASSRTDFKGDAIKAHNKGRMQAKVLIESFIEEVEEWEENDGKKEIRTEFNLADIFIVHGHDDLLKTEVELLMRQIGLKPIILHKQVDLGKTIIEKIEHYSNVGFGIVLYTPCDEGKSKNEAKMKDRARQNVVFEHGYLLGRLGRERVRFLVKGDIEIPGDISGVVYTSANYEWKYTIVKELQALGYDVSTDEIS